MSKYFSLKDPPKKNIKDGLQVAAVGGGLIIFELVSRFGFERTWNLGGIPMSVFGGAILAVGLVMLGIGFYRKNKAKDEPKESE